MGLVAPHHSSHSQATFHGDAEWHADAADYHTDPEFWGRLWHFYRYPDLLRKVSSSERAQYEAKFERCHRIDFKYWKEMVPEKRWKSPKASGAKSFEKTLERK
jgi:hypothetical protein